MNVWNMNLHECVRVETETKTHGGLQWLQIRMIDGTGRNLTVNVFGADNSAPVPVIDTDTQVSQDTPELDAAIEAVRPSRVTVNPAYDNEWKAA